MEFVSFKAGETIFTKGQVSDRAYIVQTGQVEVLRGGDEVQDHLGTLNAGAMFGEIGLLENAPRLETARAITDVTLEVVTKQDLAVLYQDSSPEIQRLISALTGKIRDLKQSTRATPHSIQSASQPQPNPSADPQQLTSSLTTLAESIEQVASKLADRCDQLEKQIRNGARSYANYSEEPELEEGVQTQNFGNWDQADELGPLKELILDDSINDILVNNAGSVYIERHGKLHRTPIQFQNNEQVLEVAQNIVRRVKRQLNPNRPLVDARLLDGSRVNIIAPPLSVDGPSISIRKFARQNLTLDDMQNQLNMSSSVAEFFKIAARCRLNILISGGTGSGKTTLLNALSQHIDHEERIVTIEDSAELRLQQPHVVRLETKPLSTRGNPEDEVTIRDLVKNSLRMRPDRIIVGEVRGPEAFDMMQAMNTGHEGSMSTIHANHPRDALARLENMVSMTSSQLTSKAVRQQIASALHLIIQVSRMRDGHRRITYISEVCGTEADVITMQDLMQFEVTGEDKHGQLTGTFKWTGILPRFLRRVAYYGEYDHLSKALGVKLPKLN